MESAFFEPDNRVSIRRSMLAASHSRQALAEACSTAVAQVTTALLDLQKPEGYWCGDLLADTTLESDYVVLQLWLHPPREGRWNPPSMGRILRARRAILDRQ